MGFEGYLTSLSDHPDGEELVSLVLSLDVPPITGPFPDIGLVAAGIPTHDEDDLVLVDASRFCVEPAYDGTRAPRGALPIRLRRAAHDRLVQVCDYLPPGFGIAVMDGWRSLGFQHELTDFYGESAVALGYVSGVDDTVGFVPPHVTGGAVDLTLTWNEVGLALGTEFDAFNVRAHVDALEEEGSPERAARRLLFHAMTSAGFAPYPFEWWHFSYGDNHWANWHGHRSPRYGAVGAVS